MTEMGFNGFALFGVQACGRKSIGDCGVDGDGDGMLDLEMREMGGEEFIAPLRYTSLKILDLIVLGANEGLKDT